MTSGCIKKRQNKMKSTTQLVLFFIFLSFLPNNALCAEQEITINATMQYNYAESCFNNKDYTTAIFEYKRFIYFFKDHENVLMARYKIGQTFYKLKEYKKAVIAFNKIILADNAEVLISSEPDLAESFVVDAYFMKSKSLLLLEKFNASEVCLHNLLMITNDKIIQDKAYSFLTLMHLKMAETDPDSLKRAEKYLQKVSLENIDQSQKDKLKKALVEMDNLDKKSPAFAGFASIIPGAGYMYCGRYKDGIVSFLFNTALMIAAYKAFDNDNYALAGAIGFVETGFYTGNIYGAMNSAHKYNRRKRNEYIKNIHPKFHLKIDNSEKDEQIYLFFEIPF